jgi:ABC-type branched-subunit amino acid transport system substrate-binding protein
MVLHSILSCEKTLVLCGCRSWSWPFGKILPVSAFGQGAAPIKIGFGMALTGPLAPNGQQALLGSQIWAEEVNANGGLLGRQVQLIHYDD